jgi:type IV secretion system protein VirD4
MYRILRYLLIATVLLLAYLGALVVYVVPYAWLVALGIGAFMVCRKSYRYTSHGSARWAELEDLEGMIDE